MNFLQPTSVVLGTFFSILPVVASPLDSSVLTSQRGTNSKVYKEGLLRFQFQDCKRSSSSLTCSFTVTNASNSSMAIELCDISDIGATRLIDTSGNEYRALELQLGQAKESSKARYYCVRFVQTSLPPTVPLRGSATFQVPQSVSSLGELTRQVVIARQCSATSQVRQVSNFPSL